MNLNLALDTTSEKIEKVTKQIKFALQNDKEVINDTVEVHVNEISTTGINVMIILYERETNYYKFLAVKQRLICSILDVLEKENVELSYPGQSIVLKQPEKLA